MDFLSVSWEQLHDQCFSFVKKIHQERVTFDRIVCISRGGLVVSRILSDFFDLPISPFTLVSYVSLGKTTRPKIVEPLRVDISHESVLLVDEIVDRGTTLQYALEYLKRKHPKTVSSFVPIIKPWTAVRPDYWQSETTKWVVYPYEVRETLAGLQQIYQKKNASGRSFSDAIKHLPFRSDHITYFRQLLSHTQPMNRDRVRT